MKVTAWTSSPLKQHQCLRNRSVKGRSLSALVVAECHDELLQPISTRFVIATSILQLGQLPEAARSESNTVLQLAFGGGNSG